jgi:hypothetical protein
MYFDKNYQNVLFVYQSLQTISLGIRVKIKYPWKTGRGRKGAEEQGRLFNGRFLNHAGGTFYDPA